LSGCVSKDVRRPQNASRRDEYLASIVIKDQSRSLTAPLALPMNEISVKVDNEMVYLWRNR
jgi:hypothetical protein